MPIKHACKLIFVSTSFEISFEVEAVGNRMCLGMQHFDFAQIQSTLPKSTQIRSNQIKSILPKIFLLVDAVDPLHSQFQRHYLKSALAMA